MDKLIDIGINLIAALIGFWIGWAWQRVRGEIRSRKARHFWRPFVQGALRIIVGHHSEFTSFEQSGFLGVGSAMALAELRTHLEQTGLHDFTISYTNQVDGDSLKGNLILIGGPDANAISKEVSERINTTLRFGNPARYEIAIYDSATNRIYAPSTKTDSGEIIKDYGLIFKTTNPFSPNKQILLIAGSFGYGTWAGVRFALSKPFIENSLVSQGKPIECLIETDVVCGTPQDIRLVELRVLEPSTS
jgi:hypothetical protein